MGLTNLPGLDEKMMLDRKMIENSYRRYKGGNRDFCSHFSVSFQITGKFLIVFV